MMATAEPAKKRKRDENETPTAKAEKKSKKPDKHKHKSEAAGAFSLLVDDKSVDPTLSSLFAAKVQRTATTFQDLSADQCIACARNQETRSAKPAPR